MPYVNRRVDGTIKGLTAMPQEGITKEFLAEDAPEVVAFRNRHVLSDADKAERSLAGEPAFRALVKFLADRFAMTPREVIDAMRANL